MQSGWLMALGALGGGAFILASLVLGARMLLLAFRTRHLPEAALGLGLFAMGGIGYPMTAIARAAVDLDVGTRLALMLVAQALMMLGLVSVAAFNWRVYRPRSTVAGACVLGLGLIFLGLMAAQSVTDGFLAFTLENRGVHKLSVPLLGVPLAWASCESFAYWSKLRKRVALGLADAATVDRIKLWGVAAALAVGINGFSTVLQFLGLDPATSPLAGLVIGPVGLLTATSLWLAFFPPAFYRRRFVTAS